MHKLNSIICRHYSHLDLYQMQRHIHIYLIKEDKLTINNMHMNTHRSMIRWMDTHTCTCMHARTHTHTHTHIQK